MPATTKSSLTNTMKHTTPVSSLQKKPCSLEDVENSKPPPTPICEDINNRIRFNPMHSYPDFDFASYAKHRSYTLCTIDFGSTTSACFLDDGVHDITADLVSQLPLMTPPPTPTFEVRDAREKGLGMFATTPISPNTSILTEHPTIITPYLLGVSLPLSEMYTELFESLPKPVFALATCLATAEDMATKPSSEKSSSGLPQPCFYEDIMQTNALAIDLRVPLDVPHRELTTHRGLFLNTSRCNHSCSPNASWAWDPATLTLKLTAIRPITPGEEITISYIPLFDSHSQRQELLRQVYGFECCCEACTLPPYELVKRDTATSDDNALEKPVEECLDVAVADSGDNDDDTLPTFEEWCSDPTLPDDILINAHKYALCLIEQEGLEDLETTRLSIPRITNGPLEDEDEDAEAEKCWQLSAMSASIASISTNTTNTESLDHHVDAIAMCYGALGDVTNFRNWITIVKEARVGSGMHPEERIVFNRWLSNPSSFPVWKWRQKAKEKKTIRRKLKCIMWRK